MELAELKLITASNLISLRTAAGMTQAELGAKLNYSDKSVSKWERGDAIPDVYVLTQIAEIFGVSVEYLIASHDGWKSPEAEQEEVRYSAEMIVAVSALSVMTMALTVFVILWILNIIWLPIFFIGISVSLLVVIILMCYFHRKAYLQFVIAAFVLSLFVLAFVIMLPLGRKWQLFILAVPAVMLVFLSWNIRVRPRKKRRKRAE